MNRINASQLDRFQQIIKKQPLTLYRGIEKEGLRVGRDRFISQTGHPFALGHPLTHSQITTDYSEALLELITPVHNSIDGLLSSLRNVHIFVHSQLGNEVIWSASMPCRLEGNTSVRIAEYGESNLGRLKHIYRKGLDVRYGRIMQSIAGLHFNFSLDDRFWSAWQSKTEQHNEVSQPLHDFKSDRYFDLIRNFRRNSWLLMYLFGASPVVDRSFLSSELLAQLQSGQGSGGTDDIERLRLLDDHESFFKPYATSLRMGDLGYHNNAQESLAICFNTLDNFTHTLSDAIQTPYPRYQKIGVKSGDDYLQLNANILQIENEYYSAIRPKRTVKPGEKPIHALSLQGVEYVEVRCLDLNPFSDVGVTRDQIHFMDLFLLYCLLAESPVISDEECIWVDNNFNTVVNKGRLPGLTLISQGKSIELKEWAKVILTEMGLLADLMDASASESAYRDSLDQQMSKVEHPELTPSAKIISELKQQQKSWLDWAYDHSRLHQSQLRQHSQNTDLQQHFQQLALQSHIQENEIHSSDTLLFDDYLTQYLL